MEAISHASTTLGILAKDGLVIAAEKKVASKLLDETKGGEKIYIINEYVCKNGQDVLDSVALMVDQHPSFPLSSCLPYPNNLVCLES